MVATLPRARALVAGAAAVSLGAAGSSALAEPAPPPPSAPPPPAAAASSPLDPIRDAYNSVRDAVYDNVIKPYAEPSRDKLLPDQTLRMVPVGGGLTFSSAFFSGSVGGAINWPAKKPGPSSSFFIMRRSR